MIKRNKIKKRSRSKHHIYIEDLVRRLENKPYVQEVYTNISYAHGEIDVLAKQSNPERWVYYEVKPNHTKKGYNKAVRQLSRWTRYWNNYYQDNLHGVYWTPQKMQYLVKDGERRR